ncbi:unnamed protein product [Lactuca virosa]|uniref:Uncharacterized protein n=1 Tax=Lactuca virosa TaxID=75947 RepID=A0AAU9MX45_9ASTR|nr:unnamed protein product [Lactuca virosa]
MVVIHKANNVQTKEMGVAFSIPLQSLMTTQQWQGIETYLSRHCLAAPEWRRCCADCCDLKKPFSIHGLFGSKWRSAKGPPFFIPRA